jgi:hypothetical protein
MQCYSGIAPVKEASGNTEWVHFRFVCPKFLRQTFHEFASHSIGQSEWAKAYYKHLRQDEKKDHHAAVRSLAYKFAFFAVLRASIVHKDAADHLGGNGVEVRAIAPLHIALID